MAELWTAIGSVIFTWFYFVEGVWLIRLCARNGKAAEARCAEAKRRPGRVNEARVGAFGIRQF
jgi:hypothetical protein